MDSTPPVTLPPFTGEAAHLALPVAYSASPIAAVQVVTVTFAGDTMAAQLQSFGASVASSAWWDTVRAAYCSVSGGPCVGDGPAGTSVQINAAARSSYTDSVQGGPSSVQDWISSSITSGILPIPDTHSISNTLYVLYLPSTTTVSIDGIKSCVVGGFDGYHNSFVFGPSVVPYAVVVECDPLPRGSPNVPADTRLQTTTIAASHEIIEAATNPAISFDYDTYAALPRNRAWVDEVGGMEVGDLCIDPYYLNQDQTSDGPFTVQRIWSNTQAAAGLEPCLPAATDEVYFNASPSRSVLLVDVGQSTTFEVDAFSSGQMANWFLGVRDVTYPQTGGPYLSFSIAGARSSDAGTSVQVNNGSKLQVTVTLLRDPGQLPAQEADGAVVSASYASGRVRATHYWPFAVTTLANALDAGIDPTSLSPIGPSSRRPRAPVHLRWGLPDAP
jgi:hypothetical protein